MKVLGIRHVGLEVKDMDKSVLFYENLGFSKFWDKVEKPEHTGFKEDVRTVKLEDSKGQVLELTKNHPYKRHIALMTLYGKKPVEWIKDPEGNMYEVVSMKFIKDKFYVYVYLDPRKSGEYTFGDHSFRYEPFYVGKGHGLRKIYHLREDAQWCNNHFKYKICAIRKDGKEPIVEILRGRMLEEDAFELEREVILRIGRRDLCTGSLCNLTDGGVGTLKFRQTEKAKKAVSSALKGKTYEEIHGKEKAKKLKEIRSISTRERLLGKTHKEIYGEEKAKELSQKQSEFMKNNNPMHVYKIDFSGEKNPNYGRKFTEEEKKEHGVIVKKAMSREEVRLKMKEGIKRNKMKIRKTSGFNKTWKITNPDGEKLVINNLTLFCEENNLLYKKMLKVANEEENSYKGWRCERV